MGRVAVRTRGWFKINGVDVHHKNVTLLQRADGYGYTTRTEEIS